MSSSPIQLNTRSKIRSFSLPSSSNLINKRLEEELERLRLKEESSTSPSETISIGLSGLVDLFTCVNQILSLPLTQQALSLRHNDTCVSDLIKVCSHLHRICITTRGIVNQLRKLATETLSGLERQEHVDSVYVSSRKEIIKSVKSVILSLQPLIDGGGFGSSRLFERDDRLSSVMKALTCISIINFSVYESILFFLSVPVSKPNKSMSLVSKLIHKTSGSKNANATKSTGNELKDVDFALCSLSSKVVDSEKVRNVEQKLEKLKGLMEEFGNSLDRACIQLTETKSCLMNIVSM